MGKIKQQNTAGTLPRSEYFSLQIQVDQLSEYSAGCKSHDKKPFDTLEKKNLRSFLRKCKKETTLDGGSTYRTSIISLDRWSRPCNATPAMQSKTATDFGVLVEAAGSAIRTAPVEGNQAQIQQAASVRQEQQLAANTSVNSKINYQSPNTGGGSPSNAPREPCKNRKSTSHGTK